MANSKITNLTSGNPAQSGDEIPINRAGADRKITAGSIAALAAPAGSSQDIQFNSSSSFGAAAAGNFFNYNDAGPGGGSGANNPTLMMGTTSSNLTSFYLWGGSSDPNVSDPNQEVFYFNVSVGGGAAFTYGGFSTQGLQFRSYHDFFAEDAFQPILFVGDPVVFQTNFSTFNNDVAFATAKVKLASGIPFGWVSTTNAQTGTLDLILTRKAAATLHLGDVDAAAPVAQTLGVQSVVAGTSNTAGADFTIAGSQGTGTGAGGKVLVKVAEAGSTGTSQNSLTTYLTVQSKAPVALGEPTATYGGAKIIGGGYTDNAGGTQGVAFGWANATCLAVTSGGTIGFTASATDARTSAGDTLLSRKGAANLQLGAADAASPVAQTLSVQNVVAGTTNTAGVDWTFAGSIGTGTGDGGGFKFQGAVAGSTGTSQNSLATIAQFAVKDITALDGYNDRFFFDCGSGLSNPAAILKCTTSAVGPTLIFHANTNNTAGFSGRLSFYQMNLSNTLMEFGKIVCATQDATAGAEHGSFRVYVNKNGTESIKFRIGETSTGAYAAGEFHSQADHSFPDGWGSTLKLVDTVYPALWFHGTANDRGLIYAYDATSQLFWMEESTGTSDTAVDDALFWDFSASTKKIRPQTNGKWCLGSTTTSFSDLFLFSTGTINWNAGDVTITHDGTNKFIEVGAGGLRVTGHDSTTIWNGVNTQFSMVTTDANKYGMAFAAFSNDTLEQTLTFWKSRAVAYPNHTIVQAGDQLGGIQFFGSDGTNFIQAATIRVDVATDSGVSPGTNDMPGRIRFATTSDGSSSATTRWKVDHNGIFSTALAAPPVLASTWLGSNGVSSTPHVQENETTSGCAIGLSRWSNSATTGPRLMFAKSRGTSFTDYTVVQSGDFIGEIVWLGSDGTVMAPAAAIKVSVSTTPGAGDMPGKLTFSTTADGAATVTDRFSVDHAGALTGGLRVNEYDIGSAIYGDVVTPDPANGPMQKYTNSGDHVLTPGTNYGYYLVTITNDQYAGSIDTSGWTKVTGDAFDTTDTHAFRCSGSITSAASLLVVTALQ